MWTFQKGKNAHACALRDCLGVSRPFVSDTSPKCIDREGLKRRRTGTRQGWDKRFPVCVGNQLIVSYNITGKLFVSRFANFEGILGFSVLSIILADLLGNRCSFQRVQKVMVCNLRLVDFDPFLFEGSLPVSVLFRAIISTCRAAVLIFLAKCSAVNSPG